MRNISMSFLMLILFLAGASKVFALTNTQSLVLNGTNQYAAISNASSTALSPTGDFTIEAWVKLNSLPASGPFTIVDRAPSPGGYRLIAGPNSTNKIRVFYWDSLGNDTQIDSSTNFFYPSDVGQWVHVAVVVNAANKTATMYKDGIATSTSQFTSNAGSVGSSTDSFSIGATNVDSTPTWYFSGLIDEVQFWNSARTSAQVQGDMLSSLTGSESGLIGYWSMNNNLNDQTPNHFNLAGYGSTTFSEEPAHILSCTVKNGDFIGSVLQFLSCNVAFF